MNIRVYTYADFGVLIETPMNAGQELLIPQPMFSRHCRILLEKKWQLLLVPLSPKV